MSSKEPSGQSSGTSLDKDLIAQAFYSSVQLCTELAESQVKLNNLAQDYTKLSKHATSLSDALKYIVSTNFSSTVVSDILSNSLTSVRPSTSGTNLDHNGTQTTPSSKARVKLVSIACCQTSFSSSSEDGNNDTDVNGGQEAMDTSATNYIPADATSNDPEFQLHLSTTHIAPRDDDEQDNEHYKTLIFDLSSDEEESEQVNDKTSQETAKSSVKTNTTGQSSLSDDDKLVQFIDNALRDADNEPETTTSNSDLRAASTPKAFKRTASQPDNDDLFELEEEYEDDEEIENKDEGGKSGPQIVNKEESESEDDDKESISSEDDEKVSPSARKRKVIASETSNSETETPRDTEIREPVFRDEFDNVGNDLLHSDHSDKENSPDSPKAKKVEKKAEQQNSSIVTRKKVVLPSSSSSSSITGEEETSSGDNKPLEKRTPNRRVKCVQSTSEEEEDKKSNLVKNEKSTPIKAKKRLYMSDDDDENLIRLSSDTDEFKSGSESESTTSSSSFKYRGRKPTKKRKKREPSVDSDDSDVIIEENEGDLDDSAMKRRKLRKIKEDEALAQETKDALQAERERKKRIEEKRRLEAEALASTGAVEDQIEPSPSPQSAYKYLYLDVDKETKKLSLKVDPYIARALKPHQIEGVKFMYDCCFESLSLVKNGHPGGGCLLAHCMGLGKTLQVVTLVHTLLRNQELTKVKRVMIMLPVNVQTNWRSEIRKWTRDCYDQIEVYELSMLKEKIDKNVATTRLRELRTWYNQGGVLLIGYKLFVQLVEPKNPPLKADLAEFHKYLLRPGPDLVVCDEGHSLKNIRTGLNKAVVRIHTRRRIVLTGTPLQNNLVEYHCMVDFVKPNLLGTLKEFRNRFVNPIESGQHKDATQGDVIMMKRRAHVLHQMLDECVQRKDFQVIRKFLPAKREYVLSIRLSDEQISLYKRYLDFRNLGKLDALKNVGAMLFADFQELSRVWTHPWVFKLYEERLNRYEQKQAEKDFVADDDEEEIEEDDNEACEMLSEAGSSKAKTQMKRIGPLDNNPSTSNQAKPPKERWWETDIKPSDMKFQIEAGGKLIILDQIIRLCKKRGDKLLVFSQSLLSLDLIEDYLDYKHKHCKEKWVKDLDYFRLDGSTEIKLRKKSLDQFNKPSNTRARLFLISTKAGGIGINLVGANRCIIFDACWNPSHDTQSVFRIYRFGQLKNVYVYRFLAEGTMEERIYQRQVTKQGLSQRVIDEHQLDRHFTKQELQELYRFQPDTLDEKRPLPVLPDDDLLKEVFVECRKWLVKYHEHDSLLENRADEGLTEEERKAAWDEFEREKNRINIWNTSMPGGVGPQIGPMGPNFPLANGGLGLPAGLLNALHSQEQLIANLLNNNTQNPPILDRNNPPSGFNSVTHRQELGSMTRNSSSTSIPLPSSSNTWAQQAQPQQQPQAQLIRQQPQQQQAQAQQIRQQPQQQPQAQPIRQQPQQQSQQQPQAQPIRQQPQQQSQQQPQAQLIRLQPPQQHPLGPKSNNVVKQPSASTINTTAYPAPK